ncbi:SNARE domain protein [Talaromyces islandicus]|uniref:t-SNARE affecting a late Golgi compartment protein 1 n=1 Tax=Talaromyces islandicus TaxID=28573 RepID=A0A0U1LVX3_TALIS|nr:SNARE domain protein [Talaromyces islandicus]
MSDDPFLQVQSEVLNTLQTTRPLYASFLRIRSLTNSPSNPEFQQSRTELEATLTDLRADLADLHESVRAVELDPYRYGLELDEVERRRKFVADVGTEIESMAGEVAKSVVAEQQSYEQQQQQRKRQSLPNPAEFDTDDREEGDYYSAYEQQRQVEMMSNQNEQLDGVFRTVGNLREQADTMGRELEDQAVLLDDVDYLADRVGGKLASGMRRIGTIVKKNEDTYSSCCIAVLIVVLILLLILVIAL